MNPALLGRRMVTEKLMGGESVGRRMVMRKKVKALLF
jgi:hypothetical protein